MAGIDSLLDELADNAEAAVRPAAQAAAQVLYDAVMRNVASIGRVTGNLQNSIYQVYSRDDSAEGRATYHVSWNHRKAPHGWLVENGHLQKYKVYLGRDGKWYTDKKAPLPAPRHVGARPFVRPAQAQFPAALDAAVAELLKRINGGTP
ncbi:HK97 gp10 family phage protein [Paraburkholderia bengalensis]|uniref:HK97 gp10 family phage protein n=2 Tax=Paraburkholderia bengalensis TaxID=2747562 RepID=A0ABU8IRJ6_9BURK